MPGVAFRISCWHVKHVTLQGAEWKPQVRSDVHSALAAALTMPVSAASDGDSKVVLYLHQVMK